MGEVRGNPFFFSGRVERPDEFFNRRGEVERIFGYLAGAQPISVSVVGERRIGKSSLLWYVCQTGPQRFGPGWRFAYVGLDSLGEVTVETALDAMARALGEPLDVPGYEGMRRLVGRLATAGEFPVFCLDEFEAAAHLDESFQSFIRGLISANQAAFVLATEKTLDELAHAGLLTSPLYNIFAPPIVLGRFDEAAARELLARRGQVSFPESDIEQALSEAGGHPYHLQRLGYELYQKHYGGEGKMEGRPPPVRPPVTRKPPAVSAWVYWAAAAFAAATLFLFISLFLSGSAVTVGLGLGVLCAILGVVSTALFLVQEKPRSSGGGIQ
jgi:hypothetical protein